MDNNNSRHKTKPWAWQIGYFCARDGKDHDLFYGPQKVIDEFNAGYEAWTNFSQVHCQSKQA